MLEITQQDQMISEQVETLIKEREEEIKRNQLTYKNTSIWSQANFQPKSAPHEPNKHSFSTYADKLLIHLVIQEEFNFQKISQTMSNFLHNNILAYTFQYEQTKYTEQSCRERWYEMHRDRNIQTEIKEKEMENKRIKSIMGFNDPFILYNIDEKLHKMQRDQVEDEDEPKYIEVKYDGYSIFKDSIRKIGDLQKYNELQRHMRQALQKASQSVELEKPMLYTPYYDRLQHFQVLEEQLTLQKMQQMMSHPIEMQVMQRELKVLDLNERHFESRIKKEVEKKVKKERIKNEEQFEIEEDWDEYESD